MLRWLLAGLAALVALAFAALATDYAIWLLRGRPTQQVQVQVFTVMELKGQKEDFGEPEIQMRTCNNRLFAIHGTPTCSYLLAHREIVLRP